MTFDQYAVEKVQGDPELFWIIPADSTMTKGVPVMQTSDDLDEAQLRAELTKMGLLAPNIAQLIAAARASRDHKNAPQLEVLMKCKCGWKETPHSEAQVQLHCMQCKEAPALPGANWEIGKYVRAIGVLIDTLKTNVDPGAALKEATEMATKVRSPFTISIRTRKVE